MSIKIKNNQQYIKYFLILVLLLIARGLTLPAFSLVDTTEGRYAGIAKNILESGDWVTPHLWHNGELMPFLGKPPLFFWSSAICMKIFGQNEFAVRLPGLISFAMVLVTMYIVLRKYVNSEIAWRAIFFCMSSVVVFVSSGLVIVDIMLTLGISGAIFSYYAFTAEQDIKLRKHWSRMVFLFLAVGFMVKGPVAILLFVLPVFTWTVLYRKWQDLKNHAWISGSAIFFLIVSPWFILAESKNPGFLKYFFVNENFLRFIVHDYGDKYGSGHEHIRGAAIVMMLIAASPWSFYAIFRIFHYRRVLSVKSIFQDKNMNFFLIAVVVDTMFWSMARQLLMTYLFPLVPVFAVWLAFLVQEQEESKQQKSHVFSKHAFVICIITIAGLAIAGPTISRNRSTKSIIDICNDISESDKIYFVHDVPYSAYFYSKDKVVVHPGESVEISLENIEKTGNTLCVISENSYNKLPETIRKRKYCLERQGKYILLEPF